MSEQITETRICSKCGKELPVGCFRAEPRVKSGLKTECKFCKREYRKHHRSKPEVSAKRKEYQIEFKERWKEINSKGILIEGVNKFCPTCNLVKPAEHFDKAVGRKGGLAAQCKACSREFARKHLAGLKELVYEKLGHTCSRCPFSDKRALQIDHIYGGGNQEHKKIKNHICFLNKVLADEEGLYQILCANCNWIKRHENDENPLYEYKLKTE